MKYYQVGGNTYVVGDVTNDRRADFLIGIFGGLHELVLDTDNARRFEGALSTVNKAINNVIAGAAQIGAMKIALETQDEFISVLSDGLTAGVSSFVDADMTEAASRLKALQVQQQLGTQALAIANQNSLIVLKLLQQPL